MTVEAFLQYWTAHNESIIQWLLVTIVLLTLLILSRLIVGGKSSESFSGAELSTQPLKETLGKLLEETAAMKTQLASGVKVSAAAGVAAPAGSASDGGAEVATAKAELERKEKEILELKTQLQDMPKSGDATQYLSKIKELEGKLAEYEILEDDIADLSLFKEENARLKTEIETLKGGSAPAAVETPAASSDFVGEFEAAIQTAANEPVTAAEAPAPAPPMAEPPQPPAEPVPIAEPVAEPPVAAEMTEVATSEPAASPVAAEPIAAEPAPAVTPPDNGVPPAQPHPDITEDILAEFSKESSANEIISQMANSVMAPPPPLPLDIQVDANKMIEEVAALSANPTGAGGSSLEGEPDMEKIMSEVGQLEEKKT